MGKWEIVPPENISKILSGKDKLLLRCILKFWRLLCVGLHNILMFFSSLNCKSPPKYVKRFLLARDDVFMDINSLFVLILRMANTQYISFEGALCYYYIE